MKLRDNSQRAKWILVVFYVMIPLLMTIIVSDFLQYRLIQRTYTTAEVEANDLRQYVLSIIYLIWFIVAAVFFIRWFRRAYYNLRAAGLSTTFTDSWASGAWFVPILNLYRPYQIMEEIWDKTQLQIKNPFYESKILIGIWWGFWVVGRIFDQIANRLARRAETIGAVEDSTLFSMFNYTLLLATLILIILIIRKVSVWEDAFFNQSKQIPLEDHLI